MGTSFYSFRNIYCVKSKIQLQGLANQHLEFFYIVCKAILQIFWNFPLIFCRICLEILNDFFFQWFCNTSKIPLSVLALTGCLCATISMLSVHKTFVYFPRSNGKVSQKLLWSLLWCRCNEKQLTQLTFTTQHNPCNSFTQHN